MMSQWWWFCHGFGQWSVTIKNCTHCLFFKSCETWWLSGRPVASLFLFLLLIFSFSPHHAIILSFNLNCLTNRSLTWSLDCQSISEIGNGAKLGLKERLCVSPSWFVSLTVLECSLEIPVWRGSAAMKECTTVPARSGTCSGLAAVGHVEVIVTVMLFQRTGLLFFNCFLLNQFFRLTDERLDLYLHLRS